MASLDIEKQVLVDIVKNNLILSKIDLDGNILYATELFCSICGYSLEELVGTQHQIVSYDSVWNQILETKTYTGELEYKTKDGNIFYVDENITPEYDNKGEVIGFISISKDIKHQKEVEKLNLSLEHKIQEANQSLANTLKHTKESIEYAALIQSSLIPDNKLFRKYFKEYFVIWHPKDTVGGDIYLFNELRNDDECLIMCIDCTGHGVPGAFVTMLVKAIESELMMEILNKPDIQISTAWIMSFYNQKMKKLLKQEGSDSVSNVGFDGSILYYNRRDKVMRFSGAESPFFYRKPDGEIVTVKGTRKSVGYKQVPMDYQYKETIIENVEEGTKVFLTTDGYLDQNGGEKDFPFGKKRFIQIIEDYGEESMADLQEMFMYEMAEYEEQIENNDRNDDMTVIGFTI